MRKVLIYLLLFATLSAGCARLEERWVHRIHIQQGNVVTQEMVDKLEPGMSRQQVRFILGTPVLQDTFRDDRWVYLYTEQAVGGPREKRELTIFFEDNGLSRITGDLRPGGKSEEAPPPKHVNITVPDVPREEPGVLTRFWRYITLKKQRDAAKEEENLGK